MAAPPTLPRTHCSVVIATLDREESLRVVLRCLGRQTRKPAEVIICSAGAPPDRAQAERETQGLPVTILPSRERSAALQRNAGAAAASGEILAFLDDDIEFGPDVFAEILSLFENTEGASAAAISPRIGAGELPPTGRLLGSYYRLQAGFAHPDYRGRLFGYGINCYPYFGSSPPPLVQVDWLPATCLFVRAGHFREERFPAFTGYSFGEDVHLTARLARRGPLYFASRVTILHHSLPSEFKSDGVALTARKFRNAGIIARDILGYRGWSLWWRSLAHRVFVSLASAIRRPPGWGATIRGAWKTAPR